MGDTLPGLTQLVKDKLQCNICLTSVGSEAVETICPGKHTFCFGCILKYVVHSMKGREASEFDLLKCPSCRSGSCSVIPSMFLVQLGEMFETDEKQTTSEEESTGSVRHFKQSKDRMKTNYPLIFKGGNDAVITPGQMMVYSTYKRNPLGFILHRHNPSILC